MVKCQSTKTQIGSSNPAALKILVIHQALSLLSLTPSALFNKTPVSTWIHPSLNRHNGSVFKKLCFARPHENILTKLHPGEQFFKNLHFQRPKMLFSYGREAKIQRKLFSKMSRYVWTGPKITQRFQNFFLNQFLKCEQF